MIHVDAHPERMEFLEHRAQFRRDPLRQEDRHPAADAEKLDVFDGAQAAQQILEPPSERRSASPPDKEHVAHFGVLLQVIDGAVEIEFEFLFAHAADDAAARAVAAIGGAPVGDEKEDAVGIAMHQPRHGHVVILAARIGHVGRLVGHLLDARDDLAADRAIGIERIDQVEEIGRDAHGQLGVGEQHPGVFFARSARFASPVSWPSDLTLWRICHCQSFHCSGCGVGPVALAG
jgi:hypothetical protein